MIAAARLGDEDAFAALYRQEVRYVRAIGRSVLHSDDLDDLCQDVFLLAFRGLPGFAGACSFRTWISRIALHACLGRLRRFQQASNGGVHLVPLTDELVGADETLAGLPARLDLERSLRVLTPAQRQMLEMAYVEEMPAVEIAAALGVTVAQVKSTLHRAKGRVRRNS